MTFPHPGSWPTQDEVRLRNQEIVTVGISTTSHDSRLKHYVVPLVHHTLGGVPHAAVLCCPAKQAMERAWFYGLRMVAHYADLSNLVRIHALSKGAWEAWVHGKHSEAFYDLNQLVTLDWIKGIASRPSALASTTGALHAIW